MSSSNPRVAVVGAGYWGPNLARNFHNLEALSALCDKNPEHLAKWAVVYPSARATASYEEILRDRTIDAVVLATPAVTHLDLALQAMEAGKHVFVEKPLAMRQADAVQLAQKAQVRNLVLMVGHILVYHPAFEALVALVRAGELGEIRHLRSERLSLGKLRPEENVLWSFAPHDASLLTEITGEEPDFVQAFGHAILQKGIEDIVTVDLKYPSGMTAHLHLSWLEPVKRHRLTVIGSKRMAVFDDTLSEGKLRVYDRGFDCRGDTWAMRQGEETIIPYEPGEPMARECQHFLECIRSGLRPRTDGASGARVLGILERAQACLQQEQGATH